jgi:hypothetical protein
LLTFIRINKIFKKQKKFRRLYSPGKAPDTFSVECSVGPAAGLDAVTTKISDTAGNPIPTVRPVISQYGD